MKRFFLLLQTKIKKSILQNQVLIKMVLFILLFHQVHYEIQSLNIEIKRIIVDEEHFTEANYPFTIKPNL